MIAVPVACGRCPECQQGLTEYCRTVSMIVRGRDQLAPPHGGFASRITDGRVQAQPLHSRTVSLTELEATLHRLSAGPSDEIKVLVDPRLPDTTN